MEPYYSGPFSTLYVGDCREVSAGLPPKSADLLIADPPYGVQWQSGFRRVAYAPMAGDDGSVDWPLVLGEMVRRVLKSHRHVYVFGYDSDQLAGRLNLGGTAALIWNKDHIGMGDLSSPWGPEHEIVTFGSYIPSAANRNAGKGRLTARLRNGSVLTVRRANSGAVRHPDEKPVPLLRQFVESSSCLGETVFDPTCGVGSTGVAAVLAGRRFVGIELETKYADIAVGRLRTAEAIAAQAVFV